MRKLIGTALSIGLYLPLTLEAQEISPEYLVGEWCYAQVEAGGQKQEERITYVFHEDGTLLYQNNPNMPVNREGKWSQEEGELNIRPALMFLPSGILEVTQDSFVLGNSYMKLYFSRGACR